MAQKTICRNGGWYYFEDGTTMWVYGMSAAEKRIKIRHHGKIVYHTTDEQDFSAYLNRIAKVGTAVISQNYN